MSGSLRPSENRLLTRAALKSGFPAIHEYVAHPRRGVAPPGPRAPSASAVMPKDLLDDAMKVSGKGITETLIEGLHRVRRVRAYQKAMALRGRLRLDIDLGESRERRRR